MGYNLLDFRENIWLHMASILMSLLVLSKEYTRVGIVDPAYHDFASTEPKRKTTTGVRPVSGTFLIEKKTKVWKICDPLQTTKNYAIIQKSVESVEGVFNVGGELQYETVDLFKQKDGSSCGIWCIAVLEMLVSGATWSDNIYRLQPYLRIGYLHKVIGLLTAPE
ncbi:hypothetical protein PHMEG_0001634 [Phytophthora megakarya]|uniref:Ubiquitin-like protease family profile domain-containing protein n=1 Tax=Phytophthora megakarya TaxID=4795 RepID=A0A225X2B0_9STRA|nr:hypothetical protein PHMEG_0001634 [Phytophthora megakarya]